ncbi:MAG TPA: MBL fold metallo-hydrolase [Candidatus Competibacteraceae bacterium]|nr:MBL fold metallo-hydrolase [Candidatus Competibacteraceae bacterium]
MNPIVEAFYDPITGTLSYGVREPDGRHCAIIDPVLDYDARSGRTSSRNADRLVDYVRQHGLTVEWILETHVHADHLSAAAYLQEKLGGRIGIGEHVGRVQSIFKNIFHAEPDFATDGRQFDRLFGDGDTFAIGALQAQVLHTPGHTPACVSYRIGDAVFLGDTLFMPDVGTARCDFPGGDARTLYRSIRRLLSLPADSRLFVCHDYPPPGREVRWQTSIAEQRAYNPDIRDGVSEDDFVASRTARDRELDLPNLMIPSVQVNMRAGHLPPPEDNGVRYLKVPLNLL